ncbi:hypothetical protein J6590_005619 [Homalodisca vitripennis]|nr:hypothetical protein J6590_005619 [Homalodisca vitripennis]
MHLASRAFRIHREHNKKRTSLWFRQFNRPLKTTIIRSSWGNSPLLSKLPKMAYRSFAIARAVTKQVFSSFLLLVTQSPEGYHFWEDASSGNHAPYQMIGPYQGLRPDCGTLYSRSDLPLLFELVRSNASLCELASQPITNSKPLIPTRVLSWSRPLHQHHQLLNLRR